MQTIENKVVSRIYGKGRGWCFTPRAFLDLGSPEAIRIALHRLEKKGPIRRLTRGLYDYPKKHATIGLLSPNPEEIARAVRKIADNRQTYKKMAVAARRQAQKFTWNKMASQYIELYHKILN